MREEAPREADVGLRVVRRFAQRGEGLHPVPVRVNQESRELFLKDRRLAGSAERRAFLIFDFLVPSLSEGGMSEGYFLGR